MSEGRHPPLSACVFPDEDQRSSGFHGNLPAASTDQQIDALVERVMSDGGVRSFITASDPMDPADHWPDIADQWSGGQSRPSALSSKGQARERSEDVSVHAEWRGEDVVTSGVKSGRKQSFLDELVNASYGEEPGRLQGDSEEEFPVGQGERVIEVQDGSFSEFYVKTPSKSRSSGEEQRNRDVTLTLSGLKLRMMQMEENDGDGDGSSRTNLPNGSSTMDAGHTFEQTARASSDIGNLIARYQQLRASSHTAPPGQLLVPNTPPNSRSSHSTVVLSPPNSALSPASDTPSTPPNPTRFTAADRDVTRPNTRSDVDMTSWPVSQHQEDTDHQSVVSAPPDMTDRYNYDALISQSESLREKAAALRDDEVRRSAHDASLLLDDDFSDIQAQLESMSPYGGSPSPVRMAAGGEPRFTFPRPCRWAFNFSQSVNNNNNNTIYLYSARINSIALRRFT